jgi:hypothetical protein
MAKPRPLVGLLSGVAAGLVASAAMSLFRKQASKLIEQQPDGATAGDETPSPARDTSTDAVHYLVGAALGGMYGLLTEYQPDASTGFGTAYGVATATVLDQVTPTDAVQETAPLQTAVSHLVFGVVLEGMRTLLAGRRQAALPAPVAPRRIGTRGKTQG